MSKNRFEDRGVATIFSIIVSVIVMTFCLALLLVSYSLYNSSLKTRNRSKCRALAVSMSQELKESISDISFESNQAETEARTGGEDKLWFYIRDNLSESKWTSYKYGEENGTHENADRVFDIDTNDVAQGSTSVTMYWTNDEDDEEIYLYVRVESKMGDQKYSSTSCYSLEADEKYDDGDEYKWVWRYEGRGETDE